MASTLAEWKQLESAEQLVLYPSFAYSTTEGGTWRLPLQGTVYQLDPLSLRKRLMVRLLERVLRVTPDAVDQRLFQQRLVGFLAGGKRGRRIVARVGNQWHRLRGRSRGNGQFRGVLRFSADQLRALEQAGAVRAGMLHFDVGAAIEGPGFRAQQVPMIAPRGVSIITDIDDTIKETCVADRRRMLANTFLRPFEAVAGMSEVLQGWVRQGASLHYVSSSPWQLFEPLSRFRDEADFPDGSFHLRNFVLRHHMLQRLLFLRRGGKGRVIARIMRQLRGRQFVLVGDSGERDPEIYGKIARRLPGRVSAIFIRELPHRPLTAERHRKAFRRLPTGLCSIYQSAEELPDHLAVLPAYR